MNILIADDHPIFRKGLAEVLRSRLPEIQIEEADNGVQAEHIIREREPEIAILDIEMPGEDGLKVCRKIKKEGIPTKVIILTMYKNEEIFNLAMDVHAEGFVLKDNSALELIECIEEVRKGRRYVSPEMRTSLHNRSQTTSKTREVRESLQSLTKTEAKVLDMVARNFSSQEIAEELFITRKSAENYRSRICRKLGLEGTSNSLLKWVMDNREMLEYLDWE